MGASAAVRRESRALVLPGGDSGSVRLLFPGSEAAEPPGRRAAAPVPPQQRSLAALRIISRWASWRGVAVRLAELRAVRAAVPAAGCSS